MHKRIRYLLKGGKEYVSTRAYSVGGADYQIHLNVESGSFQVVDLNNASVVVAEGTGASFANLKSKAKKALIALGVPFEADARSRSLNQVA